MRGKEGKIMIIVTSRQGKRKYKYGMIEKQQKSDASDFPTI